MVVFLMLLLMLLILLLPVTFHIEVQHDDHTSSQVTIKYLFFTRKWRSGQKTRRSSRPKHGQSLLARLRQAADVSGFIRRHIHLDSLDALFLLHTGDAASTALLSGGLQGIAAIPAVHRKKVHIHILPDFFLGRTRLQARCIFHLRLGIILLTMLMLLASRPQQKARTAYGTSHW